MMGFVVTLCNSELHNQVKFILRLVALKVTVSFLPRGSRHFSERCWYNKVYRRDQVAMSVI